MRIHNKAIHVMLAPDCQLEVLAPDSVTAITLARDALPFLRGASENESAPIPGVFQEQEGDEAYTLTCLLCGVINPLLPGKTALVAMQEHQMEEHDLPAEAFLSATRISLVPEEGQAKEERFVYALSPDLAAALHLPQASYLRATRPHKDEQDLETPESTDGVISLVYKHAGCGPVEVQRVCLVGEDMHAWYGYSHGKPVVVKGVSMLPLLTRSSCFVPHIGEPFVWPRDEWELFDATASLP